MPPGNPLQSMTVSYPVVHPLRKASNPCGCGVPINKDSLIFKIGMYDIPGSCRRAIGKPEVSSLVRVHLRSEPLHSRRVQTVVLVLSLQCTNRCHPSAERDTWVIQCPPREPCVHHMWSPCAVKDRQKVPLKERASRWRGTPAFVGVVSELSGFCILIVRLSSLFCHPFPEPDVKHWGVKLVKELCRAGSVWCRANHLHPSPSHGSSERAQWGRWRCSQCCPDSLLHFRAISCSTCNIHPV